jgi:hypothetical protein
MVCSSYSPCFLFHSVFLHTGFFDLSCDVSGRFLYRPFNVGGSSIPSVQPGHRPESLGQQFGPVSACGLACLQVARREQAAAARQVTIFM